MEEMCSDCLSDRDQPATYLASTVRHGTRHRRNWLIGVRQLSKAQLAKASQPLVPLPSSAILRTERSDSKGSSLAAQYPNLAAVASYYRGLPPKGPDQAIDANGLTLVVFVKG